MQGAWRAYRVPALVAAAGIALSYFVYVWVERFEHYADTVVEVFDSSGVLLVSQRFDQAYLATLRGEHAAALHGHITGTDSRQFYKLILRSR